MSQKFFSILDRTPHTFARFFGPALDALKNVTPLVPGGNRSFQMDFEDQLRVLVYFHLQEHQSARHLLQELENDDFAREVIAPEGGIGKSSFSEAINGRGLEQLLQVFENLIRRADGMLPRQSPELGSLLAIDGSLIDSVLSMVWADYREGAKKAKAHIGFDLNRGIPRKIFLTDGKDAERPFVERILEPGQTGVMDRGYQSHRRFDRWQEMGLQFICRIKAGTKKAILESSPIDQGSIVFHDALVSLGSPNVNETRIPLRLVGYKVDGVTYWIATNRHDLSAEQIATAYKLRWEIEKFFAWWKRHLKVYHLIVRTRYGLMVQLIAGLITYLLLAIYCREVHDENVSIKRVRQLRTQIQNELRDSPILRSTPDNFVKEHDSMSSDAKT